MKIIPLLFAFLLVLSFSGCLEFGEDVETTTPTKAHIDLCRSEMYLNPSMKITPLGFKLEGSGIDNAIWFKFKTKTTDLTEMFDNKVVETSTFNDSSARFYKMKNLSWWDGASEKLLGGQVSLPYAKFMNVSIKKIEKGYIVYIMWHET